MILSGNEIKQQLGSNIVIHPFVRSFSACVREPP